MASLVIKSWRADLKGDDKGVHVIITGRRSGLIGLLLSLMGIDPITKVVVNQERLEFSWASLSGIEYRVIPLANICSTYYGFRKPWALAIQLWLLIIAVGYIAMDRLWYVDFAEILLGVGWVALIGAMIGITYYVLNQKMTLGFVESSGHINAITFKPSIIENVKIDEVQARNVSIVVQRCIEAKLRKA